MRVLLLVLSVAACGDNLTPNRAPTSEAFALTTQEDLPVTRTVEAADLDNDELAVLIPIPPDHGTVTATGLSITYNPAADYHGADQFAVVVSDGVAEAEPLAVDVTVTSVNDPPIGAMDSLSTNEDVSIARTIAQLLANDSDADVETDGQAMTITEVGTAVNGSVALAGDIVTFTPTANFNGGASFAYTLTDGIESSSITVEVVVMPVNDNPVAVDDPGFTTGIDTPITITQAQLIANDTDVESQGMLDVTLVNGAANGTIVDNNDNTYTFTPNAAFVGDATFTYTLSDGVAVDTGLVTIAVSP